MKLDRLSTSGWLSGLPGVAFATIMLLTSIPSAAADKQSDYFRNSDVPRLPVVDLPEEFLKKFGLIPSEATRHEYQREQALLQIKQLRATRDARNPDAPNAANYDPAKADPYDRPSEVLRLEGGAQTTTAERWWAARRPEIVEAFDREIYGRVPAVTPGVLWELVDTKTETIGGVKAVIKHLIGHVDNSAFPSIKIEIPLYVTLPADTKGRVPVIIQFGLPLPADIKFPPELPPGFKRPPPLKGPDWQEQLLAIGWGSAMFDPMTVQADNGGDLDKGIIGLVNQGQPRKMDDWGALRAWAWGTSRVVDYLQSDPGVAPNQIGITGHSRGGKAAIVAMAFDPRFAIGFISSSGAGGAKLMRRNYGETLEDVAALNEFHWMAGNFLKYAADPLTANDLPVDGDALIALCAPRPVFISAGNQASGDAWVDAPGMFKAAVGAGPVYLLLGGKPLETDKFPRVETALIAGDIGYRQHLYGHMEMQLPNWPTFIKFAQKYLHVEK